MIKKNALPCGWAVNRGLVSGRCPFEQVIKGELELAIE